MHSAICWRPTELFFSLYYNYLGCLSTLSTVSIKCLFSAHSFLCFSLVWFYKFFYFCFLYLYLYIYMLFFSWKFSPLLSSDFSNSQLSIAWGNMRWAFSSLNLHRATTRQMTRWDCAKALFFYCEYIFDSQKTKKLNAIFLFFLLKLFIIIINWKNN